MTTKLGVREEPAVYKVLLEQATNNLPWSLPPQWRWHQIGDVAQVVGGGTPQTNEPANFGGNIPWITPADLSGYSSKRISRGARNISAAGLANSGARLMPAGTVLFSSRAPIGYVAIASNPVATNQGFKSFVLGPALLSEFVYYWLHVAKPMAVKLASGTTFLEVSGKKIAQLPIPVAPVDAQRSVVAYLDEQLSRLDASVAALHRVQANLKRYRASVLKSACEGRLVPTEAELARQESRDFETGEQLLHRILVKRASSWTDKGLSAGSTTPDRERLPALPDGWTWAKAEQLCGFITKGTTPAASKLATSGDIQFLKVYNLTDDGVLNYANKPAFVSRETHEGELARSMAAAGDVLMNIVGPPLGQVCVVPPALSEANINQAIARFRTVLPEMNRYLAQVLLTKDVLDRSLRQAKTTVGQVNLTLQICREIAIPLPPLAEQHRIVAEADRRLSLIRVAEAQVAANLARAQRLRQSILQAAFSVPK